MAEETKKTTFEYIKHESKDDYIKFISSGGRFPNEKKHDNKARKPIILSITENSKHPWLKEAKQSKKDIKDCYTMNGTFPGGTIKLRRGESHCITLDPECKRSLIFTTSPMGGEIAKPLEGSKPLEGGHSVKIYLGYDTPMCFFYQDTKDPFLGGCIFSLPKRRFREFNPDHKKADYKPKPVKHVHPVKLKPKKEDSDSEEKPVPKKSIKKAPKKEVRKVESDEDE